ncbi:MAG: cyclase family protein [Acidimicrobiia bacterium]
MGSENWGRWGVDDERGALNLLTPEVVKAAVASIRTGKVYSLGIPIQGHGVPLLDYRGKPMRLTLADTTDDGMYEFMGMQPGSGTNEDVLVMASHTTSHMDALVHMYSENQHYNGISNKEMKALAGAAKLGIEKVGVIAARAVMLDMVAYFDEGDWLTHGRNISGADLEGAASKQGVEIRAGDIVLIRTGYLDYFFANPNSQEFAQAGLGGDGARWLASKDVVAVGSDNAAVECIPFHDNDFMHVHRILLVDYGIYMLEFLNLSDLAKDKTYEGFMTVSPLKVTGATGSPINPVFVA